MENEKNLEEVLEEVVHAQEPVPAEETVSAEEAPAEEAPAEETAPAEEGTKSEEKKATPGKMALVIGAIVVVIAIIVALLMGGTKPQEAAVETDPAALDTSVPVPTIPADGNPDDETCKGTYTVTDEEVIANADTVVATIGEHKLTNSQLQVFYWMQVQSFLSSEYGSYMMAYGVLDYTQPLDMQTCAMTGSGTWQQFFLKEALTSWQNYCALADQAKMTGMVLADEEQAYIDGIADSLAQMAQQYGMSGTEELLKYNVGAGASVEDYISIQEMMVRGSTFFASETATVDPSMEDVESFFAEHEEELAQSGITKEGKLVDVRHVLFTPEGGTTDEAGVTTYSDDEWAACEAKAQEALNAWVEGDCDEESFALMATTLTQDPGSKSTGGLYEGVQKGQMVPEFDAWCFDESREYGHYGMVKTTYGYHLMFFVGSTPIWEDYTRQALVAEKTNAMMQDLAAQYPMEVDYSAISLGLVNLGA